MHPAVAAAAEEPTTTAGPSASSLALQTDAAEGKLLT